jgi:hypothetical protein
MKYIRTAAIGSLIALAACSGNDVKTTLGLDRGVPDEFRVVSRPPLSVPPQFTLRPPAAVGEAPINQLQTTAQAQALLSGKNDAAPARATGVTVGTAAPAPVASKPTNNAETAFLNNAGASQADPRVRDEIVQDQVIAQGPVDDKSWYNFWSSANPPKPDPLVNAGQEQQRIKINADSGQSVTTGDTPTMKQRDTGLLGKIFGY